MYESLGHCLLCSKLWPPKINVFVKKKHLFHCINDPSELGKVMQCELNKICMMFRKRNKSVE